MKAYTVTAYLLTYLLTYLLNLRPYLFTYLLTLWTRVLLEKLTGFQQVKKFPAFYGTRRLITRIHKGRSPAEIVGSNPTGGMDICLL